MNQVSSSPTIAIIGGGLAGLAAGCALSGAGYRVTLFERRPYLGGRASSYQHPGTSETVDNCQHVLLGCCTNLLHFYQQTGVAAKIRWYDRLTFLEPGGRASTLGGSWLPAPLHTAPSFLAARCLGMTDKLAIARAMLRLIPAAPGDSGEPFLDWLRRHRQTDRAVARFWKTVLVSALNEDLEQISVSAAGKVFRDSFLKSAEAGRMGVPCVPLTELYNAAGDYIRSRGGELRLRATVESFQAQPQRFTLCSGGQEQIFDFGVFAVPFDALGKMLPGIPQAQPLRDAIARFETSPITGIHLWFDREISSLDHAVLLDRTIQWMFHKSRLLGRATTGEPSYVELVVSSSTSLVEKSRQEIIDLALGELKEFFPAARTAQLVKSTVIKEVHATYSPRPGIDAYRPTNQTNWPRVFLAGDWTATGWPATMEGAVRSGYLAAEALMRASGAANAKCTVDELAPRGFMRLFP